MSYDDYPDYVCDDCGEYDSSCWCYADDWDYEDDYERDCD